MERKQKSFVDFLNASFEEHLNRIAIYDCHKTIHYGTVSAEISKRGKYLKQVLSKLPYLSITGSPIGLMFTDTYELILSILGCISTRIPFMVLDPSLPPQRFQWMIEDSGLKICMTSNQTYPDLQGCEFHSMDSNALEDLGIDCKTTAFEERLRDDFAYMIYTSGSTGKPKGIRHTWAEIEDNLLYLINDDCDMGPGRNMIQLIPFYSDPSIRQLLWPLAKGASITIIHSDKRGEIDFWVNQIIVTKVTDIITVPNLLKSFIAYVKSTSHLKNVSTNICLRRVITVGEALHETTAASLVSLFPNVTLYNQYGVSEISGNLSNHVFNSSDNGENGNSSFVPIGKILPHIKHHVVDDNLNTLEEEGAVGMLIVRSDGMLACYNRGVESDKFIQFSHTTGVEETFYATSDQFRIGRNGILHFEGRIDNQVKILGHRVELQEIERVICCLEQIEKAAVVLHYESEVNILVAYYVIGQSISKTLIRNYIAKFLPSYMQPAKLIELDSFPQLPNGKVDLVKLKDLPINTLVDFEQVSEVENEIVSSIFSKILLVFKRVFNRRCITRSFNFFEAGGNSLLAFQIAQLLSLEFGFRIPSSIVFTHPIISDLEKAIISLTADAGSTVVCEIDSIQPLDQNEEGKFPLTSMQVAYIYSQLNESEQQFPPIHDYLELKLSKLDSRKLERSFNAVIEIHDMLRCVLVDHEYQMIHKTVPEYKIQVNQLGTQSLTEIESHLTQMRSKMSHQRFDLHKFPCFDIQLTQTHDCDILHISFDGTFMDARSFEILLNDWSFMYEDRDVTPNEFGYKQYMHEISAIQREVSTVDEQYWLDRLEGFPNGPELPLKHDALHKATRFDRVVNAVPIPTFKCLQDLCCSKKLSTNIVLLTAFSDVIESYCNSKTFALNITMNNRIPINTHVNHIVGNFTSTSLLELKEGIFKLSFTEKVQIVSKQFSEDMDHRMYSGVDFNRRLAVHAGSYDRYSFPVVFTNLLNIDRNYDRLFNGQYMNTNFHLTQTPHVLIDCKIYEDQRGLVLEWDYLDDVFPDGLISEMNETFFRYIVALVENSFDISNFLFLPATYGNLIKTINDTDMPFEYCSLHELFFRQINANKGSYAVISLTKQITYEKLAQMVSKAFNHIQIFGLEQTETEIIGVILEKGIEQVVSVLAILASGFAYAPIDPHWPTARIKKVIEISKMTTVLTNSKFRECYWYRKTNVLQNFVEVDKILQNESENPNWEFKYDKPHLDKVAYVIFTSGTTGVPKGVAISHKAAVNTILDMNSRCSITSNDSVLGLSELFFDLSVYDVFGTLAAGGTLVVPDASDKKEPSAWIELILKHKITLWNSVPSLLQMLLDYLITAPDLPGRELNTLKWIWLSGDRIPLSLPSDICKFVKNAKVLSLGGATEAAIWSIYYPINTISPNWVTIPYGRPLANQKVFVMNSRLQVSPMWVKGDIYISGTGLAMGYWADRDKTNASFLYDSVTGERLYKTGDNGRYLRDGCIEFLGREDTQIKVGGNRIETGEITTALRKHYLVADARVSVVNVEGMQKICASVLTEREAIGDTDVENKHAFKISQPGLRKDLNDSHETIVLENNLQDRGQFLSRKSYRVFKSEAVELGKCQELLEALCCRQEIANNWKNVTLKDLSELLSPLAQLRNHNGDFPKYMYASAGTLYPIQVYLEVGTNAVTDLANGYYYYDPQKHHLRLVCKSVPETAELSLHFVGKYSALFPIYGSFSETLMLVNLGYLLGCLPSNVNGSTVTWENFTLEEQSPSPHCKLRLLKDDQLLLKVTKATNGKSLESFLSPIQGFLYTKMVGELGIQNVSRFSLPSTSELQCVGVLTQIPQGEAGKLFGNSSIGVIFTVEDITFLSKIKSGYWSQRLMSIAGSLNLGFCPIGNADCINFDSSNSVHALFGGFVSQQQIESNQISQIFGGKERTAFLQSSITPFASNYLPHYMVPTQIQVLHSWPLTANGKVDQQKLESLLTEIRENVSQVNYSGNIHIGNFIVNIVKDVLQIENCSLQDNFHYLGGHSISAIKLFARIRSRFKIQLHLRDILQTSTLKNLVDLIQIRMISAVELDIQIKSTNIVKDIPLSFAQQGLFFLYQLNPSNSEYNIPMVTKLNGNLNYNALKHAYRRLVQRHAVFRTVFYVNGSGKPCQKILDIAEFNISRIKVDDILTAAELISVDSNLPFNLCNDLPFRVSVYEISKTENILVFTHHHIISDGWSIGIIATELTQCYNDYISGKSETHLTELTIQYKDYALWQSSNSNQFQSSLKFWKSRLSHFDILEMPTQKTRPAIFTNNGNEIRFTLNESLTQRLKQFTTKSETTLYCVLLSVTSSLLSHYSGQSNILLGSPVSNRMLSELEPLVGFFVNTVAHRIDLSDDALTFDSLIEKVTETVVESFYHQYYPFEAVVDALCVQRDLSRTPLVQVMVALQNIESDFKLDFSGMTTEEMDIPLSKTKFDLTFIFKENGNTIDCKLEYYSEVFEREFICDLAEAFVFHADCISANSSEPLKTHPLTEDSSTGKLFDIMHKDSKSNGFENISSISDFFREQVKSCSDSIAIEDDYRALSFNELDILTDTIANNLNQLLKADMFAFPIYSTNKFNTICVMLGVIKSNNAYAILDSQLPTDRINYIINDCKASYVLLDIDKDIDYIHFTGCKTISYNELISKTETISPTNSECHTPESVCTIIYTSGTTGVPKGVLVPHRAIIRMIVDTNYIEFNRNDVVAQISQLSFDASSFEIFGALLNGARLVVIPRETVLETDAFSNIIMQKHISVMLMVTSLFNSKIQVSPEIFEKLRVLVLGGEEPNTTSVQKLYKNPTGRPEIVINAYGPTENGTITTTQVIDEGIFDAEFIPIGKPIRGTFCFVLNKHMQLAPKWGFGELYIGGIGLADGYLNREQETREKFVSTSDVMRLHKKDCLKTEFSDRLFKTGDFVSVVNNGSMRFHKRIDSQVKVRGHRIELMEVKLLLLKMNEVLDVAVIICQPDNNSDAYIAVFVVLRNPRSGDELFEEAEKMLPKYMLPKRFVVLSSIPLTINGKVDFSKLRKMLNDVKSDTNMKAIHSSSDAVENWLINLWKNLLENPLVGVTDNFFRLGGHSILAITMLHKVQQIWNVQIRMKDFYNSPTIKTLSNVIQQNNVGINPSLQSSLIVPNTIDRYKPFPLLEMQIAYLIGREISSSSGKSAAHCYFEWRFNQLEISKLETGLNLLIKRHEMLRCILTREGSQVILEDPPKCIIPIICSKSGSSVEIVRTEMSHQIINLHKFPTFDIRVSRLECGFDILHLSFDGMFIDAMSLDIFFQEWNVFYNNPNCILPEIPFSFRDYTLFVEGQKGSSIYNEAKQYFDERVDTFPTGSVLPKAHDIQKQERLQFKSLAANVCNSNFKNLLKICDENDISPTCLLLAVFADIIYKFSSSKHFALNMTLFNRPPVHDDINKVIGEFTSTTLIEISNTCDNLRFLERAKLLQEQLYNNLDNRQYSALEFHRAVAKNRGMDMEGMYPVVFTSLLNTKRTAREDLFNNSFVETTHSITQTPQVLIDFKVYEDKEDLVIECDYLDGYFPADLVPQMHKMFVKEISFISENEFSVEPIYPLPTEQTELVGSVNNTQYPFEYCLLHELFFRNVHLNKHSLAVVTPLNTITYAQLNEKALILSQYLHSVGVGRQELIGVLLVKGYEQVIATLGILHSGAAYVPLDWQWPTSRICGIVKQCNVSKIITESSLLCLDLFDSEMKQKFIMIDNVLNESLVSLGRVTPIETDLEDVAYVIFTSGTTGVPKGVTISHKSAVNTILDMNMRCNVTSKDKVLGLSELHFDLSVYDIFGILEAGGCLVLPNASDRIEPSAWVELIVSQNITIWNSVPALLQMLVDYLQRGPVKGNIESLRWVWLSGDRIPIDLPKFIRTFAKETEVLSLGGATEAAIWSICYPIAKSSRNCETIPYGKPLTNQNVYILDGRLNICPIYVKGEIYIAGTGLAIGYWGDVAKTEKRFIINPKTGERLYRTGDYGKYLPDGNITFLGRMDSQVKINGNRIELGEIKVALMKDSLVKDVEVLLIKVNESYQIGACVIIDEINLQTNNSHKADISEFISSELPKNMIPSRLHLISSWPLTENGKIDLNAVRNLLINESESNSNSQDLRATPFTECEYKIMFIWQDVLQKIVPLNTQFFEAGGTSLEALKLALLISEKLETNVNVAWVYQNQTIFEQAKALQNSFGENYLKREDYIIFNGNGTKRPCILIHPGRDSAFAYAQLSKELGDDQPLIAVEYYNLFTGTILDQTVEEMASRYVKTVLGLDLQPPFILGGWSFGGLVAFEMSKQLHTAGITVKSVLMFDTPFPSDDVEIPYRGNILDIINEPEKQLFKTLSKSLQAKYCKTASVEFDAIVNYKLESENTSNYMEIVQFLPCMSDENLYQGWRNHCVNFIIEPVSGDHGSILRNKAHRVELVAKIKEYVYPKFIFILVGSNFDVSDISKLLLGHKIIALVSAKNVGKFSETFGNHFAKVLPIPEDKSIGYLCGLNFEACKSAIESELLNFEYVNKLKHVYIVSSNEGNVLVSAQLRDSFSLEWFSINGMNVQQANLFRDKIAMKNVLKNSNVKIPKFIPLKTVAIHELEQYFELLAGELNIPFIIKPTTAGGGFGVYKIKNYEQFTKIVAKLDSYLVHEAEEFLEGELYHCDIGLAKYANIPVFAECAVYSQSFMGYESEHNYIGSSNTVCPTISKNIIDFCMKAVNALGGEAGIFHCEVFRNLMNDELTFLEVGARVPGALIPKMYEMSHEVKLQELDILLQVNEPYSRLNIEKYKFGTWGVYFCREKGIVKSIKDILGINANNSSVQTHVKVGEQYDPEKSFHNVVATVVYSNEDFDCAQKMSLFLPSHKIIDIQE